MSTIVYCFRDLKSHTDTRTKFLSMGVQYYLNMPVIIGTKAFTSDFVYVTDLKIHDNLTPIKWK